jgi:type III pantothenate kinase
MTIPFLTVDIGNARTKVGLFGSLPDERLPEPVRSLSLDGDVPQFDRLTTWLNEFAAKKLPWFIASVNRPCTTSLIDWLHKHRPEDVVTILSRNDLPLIIRLESPDSVGVDRLVDAVAVNRLRENGRPAVIVDVGTAITVDLVSAEGIFLGGSILPGLAISARALNEFTALLPLIDISEFADPPPVLGTSTEAAIRSGVFWGAVGAIRQLIEQLGRDVGISSGTVPIFVSAKMRLSPLTQKSEQSLSPQVFLTGGAGLRVAELLGPHAQFVPHLTLAGIALSAMKDTQPTI